MHKSSQVCPEGRGYSSVVGDSWYPALSYGGARLCLSACPGDGEVKKLPPPEDNFWNSSKCNGFRY